jgi:hypothetical protein
MYIDSGVTRGISRSEEKMILHTMVAVMLFTAVGFPLAAQNESGDDTWEGYVFTESKTAFERSSGSRSRFVPSVTSFGSGGIGYVALPSPGAFSLQFGAGVYSLTDVPERRFRNTLVNETALAVPMYTGMRYDMYRAVDRSLDYTIFGSLIGGPVVGMSIPHQSGIANSMEALQLRWGAGGQAALGIEVFFSERWAGYAQLGVDGMGFTRRLGGERGYFGPAVGLGFGRILGR